jgi:diguanylate cyclase (GGDEF)-like protein
MRWRPAAWVWLLALGSLAYVPYAVLDGATAAGTVAWDVAVGCILAVAGFHVRRLAAHRLAWGLVLAGLGMFLVGDVTWWLLEAASDEVAYPNVGDGAYLSGYLLIAAGAVRMAAHRRRAVSVGPVVDGLIVAVAAGVLLWVFLIGPAALDPEVPWAERLVNTAYPMGDLLLIAIGAQIAMRVRWSPSALLFLVGMVAMLAADIWYALLVAGEGYTAGHPVDVLWFLSYVSVSAAIVHPSAAELDLTGHDDDVLALGRIGFLAAVAIVAPVVLGARVAADGDRYVLALVLGTVVLFLLVVMRLAIVANELATSRSQLEHDATHDPLTGLGNRALYSERVRQAIHATATTPARAAVLCIDLDDFKTVNDSLGHAAGDRMLQEIGDRLRHVVRRADSVARLGGDEFAVLVLDEPADAALEVADRLLAAISAPLTLDGGVVLQPSASIGIAYGEPDESVESLLRDADVAMYIAKNAGKSRWEVYRPGMRQRVVDRFELRSDLANALDRGELVLHYQPIIEVDSGRVSGIEALVRWEHPTKGRIEPGRFIGIAEETGLIVPIGRWILREACRRAQQLDPSERGPRVAVNVSAVQLRSPDLFDDVTDALAVSGLAPNRLLLELTESAMIDDYDTAAVRLGQIRALGVRIALDDFGAGYTSLRQLQRFPVDVVKLDQSFINTTMAHDSGVLDGLIALATSLGLDTVGEGIEETQQLSRLREAQCRYAQGYLFSRPVPSDELDAALAAAGHAAGGG